MRRVITAGFAALAIAGGAQAQTNVETRVGKLEGEMRAVQRKVFPGGAGTILQPEITGPAATNTSPGSPATSAIADLSQRVASIEREVATLTGQIEQGQQRNRQLQEQFDSYRRATDARLKALEGGPAPIATGDDAPTLVSAPPRTPARPAATPVRPVAATPEPADVPAVERPATGDAAEDAYLYGYRLWQAKRYTEAQGQLKKVVAEHPKSKRASYAQNLLGRAYLDDNKPSLASMAFYENYKKMPDGERAPDSLLYLGQALVKLNKPADACKVYGELSDVYGAKLSTAMQGQLAQGRTAAKCK